jgi:hypothetical protein
MKWIGFAGEAAITSYSLKEILTILILVWLQTDFAFAR